MKQIVKKSNLLPILQEFHYDMVVVVQNSAQGIFILAWHRVLFNEEQEMSYVQCLTILTIASEEENGLVN